MTLKEAAEIIGTTPDNLRQSIARGTLKAQKMGREWFVTPKEVERYARENRRSGGDRLE
jgi:excisionase family DNA binding protein